MLHTTRTESGPDISRRECDACHTISGPLFPWPCGSIDSAPGWKRAVGPRSGSTRPAFDLCPACAQAGTLPPGAEVPQPFPMSGV